MSTKAIGNMVSAVEKFKAANASFNEGMSMLSGGPATYYFDKMQEYAAALFTKYAPFHTGDRVRLVKAPKCENGWSGCGHFLVAGATGQIVEVDYSKGRFVGHFVPDWESFISRSGEEIEIKGDNKHSYYMSEEFFEIWTPEGEIA